MMRALCRFSLLNNPAPFPPVLLYKSQRISFPKSSSRLQVIFAHQFPQPTLVAEHSAIQPGIMILRPERHDLPGSKFPENPPVGFVLQVNDDEVLIVAIGVIGAFRKSHRNGGIKSTQL